MPEINEAELAQNYGFALAVLNSDPDLKSIFNQAVAGTWTPERFVAALRSTSWYQRNSEQTRNAAILQATDPQTYAMNLEQTRVRVSAMAAQMGAQLPDVVAFATSAYTLGWDDNQLRASLATYVQYTDGRLLGQAGQWEQELRKYAADMGVKLSDATIQHYVQSASMGTSTIDDAKGSIRSTAATAYPHLAERLAAGETVADIADPYRQTMAQLLELNPDAVTLQDPSIRRALATTGKDGKPALRGLYDFENDVRSDTRWLKTKNAQDAAMSTTRKVLEDFGLGG